jgi:NAD(P)-dependent dehydrogenase (short-subunit alcohol dehydrogenase family)
VELGEQGVRVNCVCPGAIPTPIFARGMGLPQEAAERTVEMLKEAFKERQPIHRAGDVLDIARAVLWLAGEESSFVNGQAIVVDGGLTLGGSWRAAAEQLRPLAAAFQPRGE